MQEWIQAHLGYVVGGLSVLSAITFCVSVVAIPLIVARLPTDYFLHNQKSDPPSSFFNRVVQLARNIFGCMIVFAGLLMLILPGQGVITIFIGVFLLDVPGIRAVKTRLLARSRVQIGIDWLRFKCGKPPMTWPST